ncbi:AAA-like domain-containing protein [Bacillus tianshenii]|nr:AAA-like domain-containing protein [Bacillus tianshenii]
MNDHIGEESLLVPFLSLFDVTYGQAYTSFRTSVSMYFLSPEEHTKWIFGFEQEVLLVYVPHTGFEGRVTQLVREIMSSLPAKGRVDNLCYILVSDEKKIRELVINTLTSSAHTKNIIPFYRKELYKQQDDWFVRRRLTEAMFSRDLFDVTQAMIEDTFYFGRTQFISSLIDRFKRGQNSTMFGLRKLGKTSTIFKMQGIIKATNIGISTLINGTDTKIYDKHWWQLLEEILRKVAEEATISLPKGLSESFTPENASEKFSNGMDFILKRLEIPNNRILVIIDEIEHISPETCIRSPHWNEEFVPFWQTIRAYQTTNSKISFLLVGVNPKCVETVSIGKVDNPIFGLFPTLFLPSFNRKEVRDMVRTLGRYMGMKFEEDCYEYLRSRYGGHPMLIRLACSWVKKDLDAKGEKIPFKIKLDSLKETESSRDKSLVPWARHIVEVLTIWYSIEYELLEILCMNEISDYNELVSSDPEIHKHLVGYGLVSEEEHPKILNAIVQDYMVRQVQNKKEGSKDEDQTTNSYESDPQAKWSTELEKLLDTVTHSRTFCIDMATALGLSPLFNDDKIRISVKLSDFRVTALSGSRTQFENAINTLNQVFVECVSLSKKELERLYPKYWGIHEKIRCLRHFFHHSELSDENVKKVAIQAILQIVGSFPSMRSDWEQLHLGLMNELVLGLQSIQHNMFAHSSKQKV